MKVTLSPTVKYRNAQREDVLIKLNSINGRSKRENIQELSNYAIDSMDGFEGIYNESGMYPIDGSEIFYFVSEFAKKNGIDIRPIDYPISSGTDIYLLPMTENLELVIIVVDEYYGSGDSEQYVDIQNLIVNDNTTTEDIDVFLDWAYANDLAKERTIEK